ncbi:DinG family ATP-dependent helicase YoaA [Halalkalibacter wakoensis JCM 9140]|uniref:3'-5' exonuclease DinG n=1 Tax=Halalkalibacter wakoensis JCM 9140 TaxID=1236970 RepID=W4Q012_9BACI|nr:ATP-dependent DNA helicase DinG [Halalkalibacter wakoensis]GAE25043.1 DinG family ATP-dependent helicase YoaA [Halalkalibacter wakoensis JCM 9140]
MKERYTVVDVETTGHSVAKGDRVIQIGAVVIEDNEIVETFATFVNPGQPIPAFIEELTGISDDMVKNAPSFQEISHELLLLFENSSFVAHNVDFDYAFLTNQLELIGKRFPNIPKYDTVELSRVLLPKQESYKLGQLAEQLGFSHDRPHQADSDAEVTAALFLSLLHKIKQLPILTLQQLAPISRSFKSDLEPMLQKVIQDKLLQGETDDSYDCYRQLALKKVEEVEVANESNQFESFEDFLEMLYADKGKMQSAFLQYELRQGQKDMMLQVNEAFRKNVHKIIEAGTGTGKSLAYLLPAAFFSHTTQEPVIISTKTIPLQEQLLSRDLPLLNHLLPFQVTITLLKGRSHYLCLRKFEQSLQTIAEDSYDVLLTKAMLLIWLTETENGDIEELNLPSGGKGYWYEVQSDATSDLGRYSPWFSRCFYHRARKKAQNSNIVVTNHALLCTDLVHDERLLPSYSYVILDEAHHLEETASDHLGAKVDFLSFAFLFQRLGVNQEDSIIEQLDQLIQEYQVHANMNLAVMAEMVQNVKDEIDELFRMLHGYVLSKNQSSSTDVGRLRYRYETFKEKGSMWQAILECAMRVHMQTKDCMKILQSWLAPFSDKKDDMTFKARSFIADATGFIERLMEEEQTLYELLLEHDPNMVYWIEVEPRGAKNATFLYSKPIDVSDLLADHFFAKKKSVVMTSATLAVNGSFDYQIKRLGLIDFGVETSFIPSPFSYVDQVRMLLPTDLPAIKEVSDEEFAVEVAIKIWRMMEMSSGKMLVLFTSYEMLKQVYHHLKKLNELGTFQMIGQGVTSGSRAKLMKMFKQTDQAVLFGTSSFWEGIDLPGDELKTLVIVRLPFSPPDQPLLQAQYEKAKTEGGNPFMDISLPQAIIRFKQGFGRLIRTTHDRGCVFVFDRRISTTRYGKQFIRSLPNVPVYEGKLEELLENYKDFM